MEKKYRNIENPGEHGVLMDFIFFSCVLNHIVWASFALILSDVKYKLNIWTHMFTYNKAGKTIFYV